MESSPFTLVANYRTLEPGSETDIGAWEGIMFFDTLGEGRVRVRRGRRMRFDDCRMQNEIGLIHQIGFHPACPELLGEAEGPKDLLLTKAKDNSGMENPKCKVGSWGRDGGQDKAVQG
jgi:hypothetical protein